MPDLSDELSDFVFGYSERSLFVDGKRLVVPDGGRLPPICVRTAQPVTDADMVRKVFYWAPPWTALLIFFGGIIGLAAYFFLRKKCTITYGVHRSIRNKYRLRFVGKFLTMIALFFSIFLVCTYLKNSPLAITLVFVAFFVSLIALVLGNRPIGIKNHMNGKFWFTGCSPEYLAILSRFEG